MCKRYCRPPSELLHIDEPFAAYCIDEAVSWALCRIEQDGRLPRAFDDMLAADNGAAELYKDMKGVRFNDYRRNSRGLSDA